ncbi:MAG TPA: flavin reductase family protein [Acidimicrobiales bacterium]|nr:flavin reductase family protein [Acidimicrobiales bacterium]
MAPHASIVGPFPPGADRVQYDRLRRRVLWRLTTGLYLFGTRAGARRNLMTCSLVTQLATDPKLVGVSVERAATSLALAREGGGFALTLVDRADRAVVRTFAKPAVEDVPARTLSGRAYEDAPVTGAPVLAGAAAYLDCRLEREVDLGSHVLCVGEVVGAGFGDAGEDVAVLRSEDTRMSYGG